ncbi:MAG TPA: YdcF family protein [Vicinamibacterales bacterium]
MNVPVPPTRIRAGGRLRLILVLLVLAAAASALYAFMQIGNYLTREDPLTRADAIFVLAGTRLVRPLEGADLYLEGYAPTLVMSRALDEERAINDIARRGHAFASDAERARDVFASLGIPRAAILIPDGRHDSTAEEAITLRALAIERGWKRVIVVTSKYHLRRGGFAMRRELRGTDVQVIMRGSRYDGMRGERWWTRRAEARWVVSELPKLVAYVLGLGAYWG